MNELLQALDGGLIVSCQPVDDGPMDRPDIVAALALAAKAGGARALRIEGPENVAAVAAVCDLPVVAIWKRDLADSPVRITPFINDVQALAAAGASIIAVDATDRVRPAPVADLVRAIHDAGCLAMADLSNIAEARAAHALGFDIIGTTMSGYTGGPIPNEPDFDFIEQCTALGTFVVAEGRFNTPLLAGEALRHGANAVCVGSAITRQEHVTTWFAEAVATAGIAQSGTALAFDIGGTKSLAALVSGGKIIAETTAPTTGKIGSPEWFDHLAEMVRPWAGRYDAVGAAVSGLVVDGKWRALNPVTLDIPRDTPIEAELSRRLGGLQVTALNDAQAAAWGEHRFGNGRRKNVFFVTVSSGIGGGLVLDGKVVIGSRGLSGSLGQTRMPNGRRLEETASGFGMGAAARSQGKTGDTREIFAAAEAGADWAISIIDAASRELANALVNVQMLIDPDAVILAGGIGGLPYFRKRLVHHLDLVEDTFRPNLVGAGLGVHAGAIGISDLALCRQPMLSP